MDWGAWRCVESGEGTMARVILYSRFERFWHWSQSLLIIVMLVTGFEIHGTYSLLGFEQAKFSSWSGVGAVSDSCLHLK